ncbi:hypothetical protein Gorai_002844 [Gossypium raimondii]|uniref:Uncharacterized protein n=1 Tax=Gossypium raimondii TaxID=29730 RepID=A0A7J8QMV2_GOSRA|nr:hypothetical protein [Gossypium raimondii]
MGPRGKKNWAKHNLLNYFSQFCRKQLMHCLKTMLLSYIMSRLSMVLS